MDDISEVLQFDPMGDDEEENPEENEVSNVLRFDPGATPPPQQPAQAPQQQQALPQQDMATLTPPEISWDDALTQGVANLPSSGAEYVKTAIKGMVDLVTSPVEAFKGFASLAKGFVKTGILRIMADELGYDYKELDAAAKDKDINIVEQIESGMKETYLTEKGLKEKIANDPAGLFADAGSILAPLAKSLGVSKVASFTEPLSLATKIISQPLKLIPEKVPIKMYQSAVKFGTTLSQAERLSVTKTAIDVQNKIMPTANGMLKLRDKIDAFNEQVNDLLKKSTQKGQRLPVTGLWKGIEDLKASSKLISDEPLKWNQALTAMKKNWAEMLKGGWDRTPEQMQKIKTRIYKDLESYYEKQKASPAKVDLRKAVARNARKMLEDIIPETKQVKRWFEKPNPTGIKEINKAEGALIELWDAIESKSNRISNRDFISIGLPVKMGTGAGIGGMVGGPQGAAWGSGLGFMLGVYDTPQVKAKLAILINTMRDSGITIHPTVAGSMLGLYQTGRLENKNEY